jgi:hypothetical protein
MKPAKDEITCYWFKQTTLQTHVYYKYGAEQDCMQAVYGAVYGAEQDCMQDNSHFSITSMKLRFIEVLIKREKSECHKELVLASVIIVDQSSSI